MNREEWTKRARQGQLQNKSEIVLCTLPVWRQTTLPSSVAVVCMLVTDEQIRTFALVQSVNKYRSRTYCGRTIITVDDNCQKRFLPKYIAQIWRLFHKMYTLLLQPLKTFLVSRYKQSTQPRHVHTRQLCVSFSLLLLAFRMRDHLKHTHTHMKRIRRDRAHLLATKFLLWGNQFLICMQCPGEYLVIYSHSARAWSTHACMHVRTIFVVYKHETTAGQAHRCLLCLQLKFMHTSLTFSLWDFFPYGLYAEVCVVGTHAHVYKYKLSRILEHTLVGH